jgi:prevent-host-death family protein
MPPGCGRVLLDLVQTLVHSGGVTEVNVHEAKTHLSRLLARVEAGEEVLISRAGQPVARLVPARRARGKRRPGRFVGKGRIADDFNAPLPPEVLAEFLK